MSSVSKKAAAKAARSARVEELKIKIHDPAYLDGAIQRIAQVLSNSLVVDKNISQGHSFYGIR
ncbi:MAG: hypothetical protein MJ196_09630 [Treponemataceae bacterium]|nr:hypothetical protein [Treponemataceae bacterium]